MSSSDGGLDPTTARLLSVGMAFLAGVLVGGVLLTAFPLGGGGPSIAPPDPENPPVSVSMGGPSCWDAETDLNPNAGWVHEVASGVSYPVTLNATVVHPAGTEVDTSDSPVTRRSPGVYEIAIRTTEAEDGGPTGCERVRTTLGIAVSLPTEYERLVVTAEGYDDPLVDAERDDTTADLYPLPNPINVTG